jgi:hypothetical protein
MSYVNVNIVTKNLAGQPVPGVLVRVLVPGTLQTITTQLTDSNGVAALVLWGSTNYEVRLFKSTYRTPAPLSLQLLEAAVEAEARMLALADPVSDNPAVCMVYGTGLSLSGSRAGLSITVRADQLGLLMEVGGRYHLMSGQRTYTADQATGELAIPLLRKGCYEAIIHSREDEVISFYVPDRDNADYTELLWPYLKTLTPDPSPQLTMTVGEEITYELTAEMSDTKAPAADQLNFEVTSSDPAIAEVIRAGASITVLAKAAGTCSIQVTTPHEYPRNPLPPSPLSFNLTVS